MTLIEALESIGAAGPRPREAWAAVRQLGTRGWGPNPWIYEIIERAGIRYRIPAWPSPYRGYDKDEWDYASLADEAKAIVRELETCDREIADHKDDARWLIGEGLLPRAIVTTRIALGWCAKRRGLQARLAEMANGKLA